MNTKDTTKSKLTEPRVETGELDDATLDQVSGGGFLRGDLYKTMNTGGVQVGSFGTNNTEAVTVSAPICDDTLISQTYFCPKLTS